MKPALIILALFFTVANLADCITFLMLGEAGVKGDSNPLIILFGTPIALIIFKVLIIILPWIVFYLYDKDEITWPFKMKVKSSEWARYSMILTIVLGTITLGLGAYSNIIGLQNPAVVQQAISTPPTERIQYYRNFILLVFAAPFVCGAIAFKIWEWANGRRHS